MKEIWIKYFTLVLFAIMRTYLVPTKINQVEMTICSEKY